MKKMNSDRHKCNDKLELMAEEVRSSSLAMLLQINIGRWMEVDASRSTNMSEVCRVPKTC